MKYGIITHYDVHNHGALLQLNGLKQVLKSLGIEASALQFDKNYDFMGRAMKAKYEISFKSVGIYMKFIAERGLKSTFFNYKKSKLLNGFRKEMQLVGHYYTECGELNGVVVGSDEVFALHTGPTPAFFGHALPSKKSLHTVAVLVLLLLRKSTNGIAEPLLQAVLVVCAVLVCATRTLSVLPTN